jgi:hypothetical protein
MEAHERFKTANLVDLTIDVSALYLKGAVKIRDFPGFREPLNERTRACAALLRALPQWANNCDAPLLFPPQWFSPYHGEERAVGYNNAENVHDL